MVPVGEGPPWKYVLLPPNCSLVPFWGVGPRWFPFVKSPSEVFPYCHSPHPPKSILQTMLWTSDYYVGVETMLWTSDVVKDPSVPR